MKPPDNPILLGSSGWSYPDWVGPFYPEGMAASDFLDFYADHFPIVEVDSTFYRPPTAGMVRNWKNRTPESFRFALKVPRVITHEKMLRDCREEVDGFVSSIEPLGPKIFCALLQFGYFNQKAFASLDAFLDVLDPFLDQWPHHTVPLAVEVRNPRWVGEALLGLLREHHTAFVLTEQTWMPSIAQVVGSFDTITGPVGFIRLLGDREGIEKITTTWDRTVVDRSADLERIADIIRLIAETVPVAVFANNHYAGYSPETLRMLRESLKLPAPVVPERPRTTLFD